MPVYSVSRNEITPSTTTSNWVLSANASGEIARILSFSWGGQATTSTAMFTRWGRPTGAGSGAATALVGEDHSPNYSTPLILTEHTYATMQETFPAAPVALHGQSWNCHGGVGYIALPIAAPWVVVNGVQQGLLACRNDTGTGTSSYGLVWEEV